MVKGETVSRNHDEAHIDFPAPIPGLTQSRYAEIAERIEKAAFTNALEGIRSNQSEVALDAIGDGIRLLSSVIEFARDASPNDRTNEASLRSAALNPQFGGMGAMHSIRQKADNLKAYEASTAYAASISLSETDATKSARACVIKLRNFRKRIRCLAPQIAARAAQKPKRTTGG